MAPFETTLRRHLAEAESDAQTEGHSLRAVRRRDAEFLRGMLRTWEASLTPEGREAAQCGLPTGPFDGGLV